MTSKTGEIIINPYGYYLSWEIRFKPKLSYINLWGGNMSLIYCLFHSPLELVLTKYIFLSNRNYVRTYRWADYESKNIRFFNETIDQWQSLFEVIDRNDMNCIFHIDSQRLGIVLPNVYEKDSIEQPTLKQVDRENIRHIIISIYQLAVAFK